MLSIISKEAGLRTLMNRLYSFDRGAKSENLDVIGAMKKVKSSFDKKLTHIFDRGMDRPACRDAIISTGDNFALRVNASTKLIFRGAEMQVREISKKVILSIELYNFIYYKISSIIESLFASLKPRAFLPTFEPQSNKGQLRIQFAFDE